jgi:hypothetical protein
MLGTAKLRLAPSFGAMATAVGLSYASFWASFAFFHLLRSELKTGQNRVLPKRKSPSCCTSTT